MPLCIFLWSGISTNFNLKDISLYTDKKIRNVIKLKKQYYNCVILSVGHNYFKKIGYKKINSYLLPNGLIFDIKNILPKNKKSLYL